MPKAKKSKKKEQKPLHEEEIQELITDLEDFEHKFLLYLARTDRYDIVSTTTDAGRALTKEQLSLIKQECLRLGIKPLYKVELKKAILLINPENTKIGYLTEGSIN